ncbi:fatty acid synthase S-acetyltransferase [Lasiosphaeria ovina]|uniref:Fatty acid synthase S-acetyltransferase n=1 Tax=Lasiosphaeria ovina TaxID=92902 RepID=A0AAE0NJG9_9PEZI|nr:fatty acid synthase S-acetyltransferase [Lasiosphaeria ovina]
MEDDIAVIGFSIKLPQGVDDVASFWDVLAHRKNLSTNWPESRIKIGSVTSSNYNKVQCRGGHFIDEDPAVFDAPFFSVTAKEAASMDPMQRWTLEASYRAFESAGILVESLNGSRTAVFSASMSDDYNRMTAQDPEDHPRMAATGNFASIIPNRVSWYFDLRGPSVHVDSACSSSLLAVDLACQSIKSGEASAALVTGSNLILGPTVFQLLSAQGFMSPDSRCFSFDHRANGYARGEGVIALVVKPLLDAVRDGDMIRAVIRGSGSNQDGHTPILTQPSSGAQEDLIRRVYKNANLPLDQTRYFEAHGTGTPVGDPLEMKAIGKVFRNSRSTEEPLYVGSVKANIGHLEGSSGLAGVIKSILALEKGVIPPNALFEKMNPKIDAEWYHIEVPTVPTAWPCEGLRRVSVNSFGFGGTNTHVVMDDALYYLEERGLAGNHNTTAHPIAETAANGYAASNGNGTNNNGTNGTHRKAANGINGINSINGSNGINGSVDVNGTKGTNGTNGSHKTNGHTSISLSDDSPRLLVWTAADEKAVERMTKQYTAFIASTINTSTSTAKLDQLAYTLAARRSRMLWREFALVRSSSAQPPSVATSKKPTRSFGGSGDGGGVAFVFTGQGAQYVGMGAGLLQYPVFRETLYAVDGVYRELGCGWSVFDELHNSDRIDSPEYSQPLSTAVQLALVELLKSFGIAPKAVVGHSSGEIAAAYAIGALSLASACKVSFFRGQLAGKLRAASRSAPGAMMSVNLAEDAVAAYIDKTGVPGLAAAVNVACINSPGNVTLSGSEAALDQLKAHLDRDGVFAHKLKTGVAYHSPYMARIADEYLGSMGSLEGSSSAKQKPGAAIPMVSSVTGRAVRDGGAVLATAQYWVDNMVSPVRFAEAVRVLTRETASLRVGLGSITDLVEVGPHPALRRPIEDTLKADGDTSSAARWTYSWVLHRSQPAVDSAMELAGKLFCRGHGVRVDAVNMMQHENTKPRPFAVDAPEYPFDHSKRYWAESRLSREYRLREETTGALLGARSYDWNPLEPRWRNFWSVETAPWTGDHVVSNTVILPGAAMLVMAVEAVQNHLCPPPQKVAGFYVQEARFLSPIVVPAAWDDRAETMVHLRPVRGKDGAGESLRDRAASAWAEVVIYSYRDSQQPWTECFRATVQAQFDDDDAAVGADAREERRLANAAVKGEHERAAVACAARPIDAAVFYDDAAEHGIGWGDWFRVLGDMGWDGAARAVGRVDLGVNKSATAARYQTASLVHPAVLDGVFQALRLATTRGLRLSAATTHIPVRVADAWFAPRGWQAPDTSSVRYLATSRGAPGRERCEGAVTALADDGTVLCTMGSLTMAAVSTGDTHDKNEKTLLHRIEWKPQLSLLAPAQLAAVCDADAIDKDEATMRLHYGKLRVVLDHAIARALQAIDAPDSAVRVPASLARHVDWMRYYVQQQQTQNPASPFSASTTPLVTTATTPPAEPISADALEALVQEIETLHPAWKLHATVVRSLPAMLSGSVDPLQVIFGGDEADTFYADMFATVCDSRLHSFLALAAHENPQLRILEVGAGTGGMTGRVLGALLGVEAASGNAGVRCFAEYAYTDVSPAFFERAAARWDRVRDRMAFRAFDMKADPAGQGFKEGAYDLVVAGSVLHATEDLMGTMRNVRKLLKPGSGRLLVLEAIAPDDVASNFTFGLVPGWWGKREPWRGLSPAIPEKQWDTVLRESGFSGNDLCLRDYASDDCHLFSVIVSRAVEEAADDEKKADTAPSRLTIVVADDAATHQTRLASLLCTQLTAQETRVVALDALHAAELGEHDTVVSIAEVRQPLLARLSPPRFLAVQDLIRRAQRLLWVTAVADSGDDSAECAPEYSVVQGFLRTLRAEEGAAKRLVGLAIESFAHDDSKNDDDDNNDACAGFIATALRAAFSTSSSASPELEYVVRDGLLTTGRVVADAAQNTALHALLQPQLRHEPWLASPAESAPLQLRMGKTLEELHFVEDTVCRADAPLGAREVEVEAKTWAVNFRDVLVALGRISEEVGDGDGDGDDEGGGGGGDLGNDCAGIVTRVGSAVGSVAPGDRVVMVAPGAMRAFPRADERAVLRIPSDSLSFEAAASVLVPGMTAVYALREVARLRRGDRVLVHAAAGSTGQMAVWVARLAGADVFATTSSPEKRAFLRDTLGIPEDRIFYSRDMSFAKGIMRVTGGRGVDVVLNSLTGEGLRAGWQCVAPYGRFVDIAEADIRENANLPMGRFAHNVSFAAVDLHHIARTDLELTARLLRETVDLLADGKIQHPAPLHFYPVSQVERAFRHLQGGKNIGRIMITVDRDDVVPQLVLRHRPWTFDPQASYVIAGGSGGLGRAIARWMVSRGARYLILPSRSGGASSKAASELVAELRAKGARVEVPACDVSDASALARMLADYHEVHGMPAVRGCINAAMVLQDAVFANMTHAQWELTLRSKVQTSWNLHRQLPAGLDFFVMLSSLIGVLGGMGQSNYAAGDAFQDALARHRVRRGQRAVAIDVGWMRSIGIVAEKAEYQRNLKTSEDMQQLDEDEMLALLTLLCDPSRPQPPLSPAAEHDAQVLFGLRTPDEFLARGQQPPELLDRPLFAAFAHAPTDSAAGGQGREAGGAEQTAAAAFRATEDTNERIQIVLRALARKLARAMAISADDVELGKPLSSYGVDSLMAVELRNWIGKDFQATVAVFDIMGNVPIAKIGDLVVARSSVGKS